MKRGASELCPLDTGMSLPKFTVHRHARSPSTRRRIAHSSRLVSYDLVWAFWTWPVIGDGCRIFAVDVSGEMLNIMRRSVTGPGVQFVQSSADGFAQHIPEKVDRVFCNAAFWHFSDSSAVLQEVGAVLNPEGLFLFNLPDHEFDFGDGRRSEMERLILERLGQPERKEPCRFCHEGIRALATGNGFAIAAFEIVDLRLSGEDLIRLGSIPPIGAEGYPGTSPAERQEILAKAFGHLGHEQLPHYRWAQYTFKSSKDGMN